MTSERSKSLQGHQGLGFRFQFTKPVLKKASHRERALKTCGGSRCVRAPWRAHPACLLPFPPSKSHCLRDCGILTDSGGKIQVLICFYWSSALLESLQGCVHLLSESPVNHLHKQPLHGQRVKHTHRNTVPSRVVRALCHLSSGVPKRATAELLRTLLPCKLRRQDLPLHSERNGRVVNSCHFFWSLLFPPPHSLHLYRG